MSKVQLLNADEKSVLAESIRRRGLNETARLVGATRAALASCMVDAGRDGSVLVVRAGLANLNTAAPIRGV